MDKILYNRLRHQPTSVSTLRIISNKVTLQGTQDEDFHRVGFAFIGRKHQRCCLTASPLYVFSSQAYTIANNIQDTFPALTGTSDWSVVRQTVNFQSNAGLTDVTSPQLRCYTSGTKGAQTQTVAAGSSVSFKANPNIFHPGPLQFYMAKVPSGQSLSTFDGSDNVWFKIYAEKAMVSGGQLSWASLSTSSSSSCL
jgi:hypothetical protein